MIVAHYGLQRALYEGVSMSFLTQLNRPSYPLMMELIKKHLAKKGYVRGRRNVGRTTQGAIIA